MKPVFLTLSLLLAAFSSLNVAAADCRSVVDATVAELKAAYPEWDDNLEMLARTAAGSACVKASASGQPAVTSSRINEQAVRADGAVMPVADVQETTASTAAASSSEASSSSKTKESSEENWNPFKDIKFNKVSASPNKKPYERRRESKDDDDE